jgi:hypothetical protein
MSVGKSCAVELLLCTVSDRKPGEPGIDAGDRSDISEEAVLRISPDNGRASVVGVCGQSQAGEASDASDGHSGGNTGPSYEQGASIACRISVPSQRTSDHYSEPGMVCGHNIYTDAARFSVFGCDHGLVQPVRAGMGVVQQSVGEILCRCAGAHTVAGQSGNFQYGPGKPVYKRCLYESPEGGRGTYQHGRPWSCDGQYIYRTAVVEREIRRSIPQGLRECIGSSQISCKVFYILQYRAQTSESRRLDTGRNAQELITMCPSPRGEGGGKKHSFKKKKKIHSIHLNLCCFLSKEWGQGH